MLALMGCTGAQIADCTPGRFVRVDGQPWCVFPTTTTRCPRALPFEHSLPWGGRGCAEEHHDTLPEGLCEAAGECDGDAG